MGIKIEKVSKDLELECIAGANALQKEVKVDLLTRPGVEISGFLDFFEPDRIILIGSKENSFLNLLKKEVQKERLEKIFEKRPPAIVFSVNVDISQTFIDLGNQYDVCILKSKNRTTAVSGELYNYLHKKLAPRKTVHGVLLDIHGMGVLLTGKSGIGKSETALELIKRGHILVSDDRVDIFEAVHGVLVGQAPKILQGYIEVRGIGIVDVVSMFGAGAYRESKKIRLVVELEKWQDDKNYDRLGIETQMIKIFSTELAKITIPILPGRNVATLVESAAMNQKLKFLGYNAAERLTSEVARRAKGQRRETDDDEGYND